MSQVKHMGRNLEKISAQKKRRNSEIISVRNFAGSNYDSVFTSLERKRWSHARKRFSRPLAVNLFDAL
jgi:hypothetical protein